MRMMYYMTILFCAVSIAVLYTTLTAPTQADLCAQRWDGSGFTVDWHAGSCRVQVDGRWIPENSVRLPLAGTGATPAAAD